MLRGLLGLGSLPRFVVYTLLAGMLALSGLAGELEGASSLDACTAELNAELLAAEGPETGESLVVAEGEGGSDDVPEPEQDEPEEADGEAEDAPEAGPGLRGGVVRVPRLARAEDAPHRHGHREGMSGRWLGGRNGARAPPGRG